MWISTNMSLLLSWNNHIGIRASLLSKPKITEMLPAKVRKPRKSNYPHGITLILRSYLNFNISEMNSYLRITLLGCMMKNSCVASELSYFIHKKSG